MNTGWNMDILDIDIETFSSVDLKKSNVYAYSESIDFTVLMAAWSLNDSPVQVAIGEKEILEIPGLWDPEVKKCAHNAGFERVCLSRLTPMRIGEYLPPEEWFDTLAIAAEYGYPRSLDSLAKALKVPTKDPAGSSLINMFTKPYRGRRILPEERPERWDAFVEYCRQDVVVLQAVRHALPGWPSKFERQLWYIDQRINDRGIKVDIDMARAALEAAEENNAKASARVIEITGISNPNSPQQLAVWLAPRLDAVGLRLPNLQAATVKHLLMDSRLDDPEVREVLELREELALVASRKYAAALRSVSADKRLRGQFMFHAAHTGRWSSRGVQVHNLPRKAFTIEDPETGDEVTDWHAINWRIDALKLGCGATPQDLKRLVRPMFEGPFTIADFSGIEARVLAWLAGEQWVLDAVEAGRDLYVETAERMGGGMQRPEGKIAVLAGGYQGSVGSLRNMGYGGRLCPLDTIVPKPRKNTKTGKHTESHDSGLIGEVRERFYERSQDAEKTEEFMNRDAVLRFLDKHQYVPEDPDEREAHRAFVLTALGGHAAEIERDPNHKCDFEIKRVVDAYREANSRITRFWHEMERVFWAGGNVNEMIYVTPVGNQRRVRLPSGRVLCYHGVSKRPATIVDEVTGTEREVMQISYTHVQGYRDATYGGRLTENVTQAVARDLLADAMIRLEQAGYYVVGHVHDEVVVESDDVEGIRSIMREGPEWSQGLPLDASADLVERYTK